MSLVVSSEYVPVAVNCRSTPSATLGSTGVIWIDTSVASVTVRSVVPVIDPDVAEIVVVPRLPWVVARPSEPAVFETSAIDSTLDAQVTAAVMSAVVVSENVPVAVNWTSTPSGVLGLVGVTSIETSVAPLTVRSVLPLIAPSVAEIDVVPVPAGVASPPAAIVATPVSELSHVTDAVRFWVDVSENVPVAVNWTGTPSVVVESVGVTAIDSSVASVTVTVVESAIPSTVAEMLASPGALPVTRPAVSTVAIALSSLAHVSVAVRFIVEPSLYVLVAVICTVVPSAIDGAVGSTWIDTRVAFAVTATATVAVSPPRPVAVTVAEPVAAPVIVALAPEPETVAVAGLLDAQVTSSAGIIAP